MEIFNLLLHKIIVSHLHWKPSEDRNAECASFNEKVSYLTSNSEKN
jgi:hypothetical protein